MVNLRKLDTANESDLFAAVTLMCSHIYPLNVCKVDVEDETEVVPNCVSVFRDKYVLIIAGEHKRGLQLFECNAEICSAETTLF